MPTLNIQTPAGSCDAHFLPQSTPRPSVILYMDAFGIRPTLIAMAQRLHQNNYNVLLPNLYYRSGPFPPFNPATAFKDPNEKPRISALYQSLTVPLVMQDTAAFLNFLDQQPNSKNQNIGTTGYCMGGSFALAAAGTFPNKITAAASFHGGRLATDSPDSPHLLAPQIKARLYIGIAGIDPNFTPEEKARLEFALQAANVPHLTETYPDVHHGFAIADHPAYNAQAAERHWQQLLQLFAENL